MFSLCQRRVPLQGHIEGSQTNISHTYCLKSMHGTFCVLIDLGTYRGQNRPTSEWWKKGSSTIYSYALIHLLHQWFTDTDALKPVVDIVLIDFAQAYKQPCQPQYNCKEIYMDVPPILTQWESAFLHNRQQCGKIGSTISPWIHMNGGVLQGAKLGVPLFWVMINNLKTRNPTSMDDTTLHKRKPVVGPGLLQMSLNMVIEWANDNDVSLNANKTKHLLLNSTKM